MSDHRLTVTRPFLPPLEEFLPYLENIWASAQLSNGGPYHNALEIALARYLDVPFVSLTHNGTLALMLALRALDLQGEVITTPFSFVATSHALRWVGLTPVFADIDPVSLNLCPRAAAAAVSAATTALLPVHVFGRPCDTALDALAQAHGLRLVFDGAHAFGVTTTPPLAARGDLTALSFHATKVFHTFEGGAVVSATAALKAKIDQLRNFGISSEVDIDTIGLNAKMNEIQAAFGLVHLQHADAVIAQRAALAQRYTQALASMRGIELLAASPAQRDAHAYLPLRVKANHACGRDALHAQLKAAGIQARRYFHPLLADLPMYRNVRGARDLPVARQVAQEILCLPLFPGMTDADVDRVVNAIARHS